MKKPTDRQLEAIKRLLLGSEISEAFIGWLKDDRDEERNGMEGAPKDKVQIYQGRSQKNTDLINFLESLAKPRRGPALKKN